MKFSISKENILPALQLISGVVEKKQTLPILSHVLLDVNEDILSLSGTDLELEMEIKVKAENVINGKATVSARKIFDIVRSLPDSEEINFQADKSQILVTSGKTRFSLGSLEVADFPKTSKNKSDNEFTLESGALRKLLENTSFSMAMQDVRYYLNGILLETEADNINVVATDGHRLAIDSLKQHIDFKEKNQVIIPRKMVMELTKFLSNSEDMTTLGFSENRIYVKNAGNTLFSKLIDGRYPDYQRVIPENVDQIAIFDRDELKNSLMRTAILSNEKYRGIRMNFSSGTVKISANNPEQEEAHDEIDVNYAGEDIEIGFNVSYLLDAINAVDSSSIKFSFKDANSSAIIQNQDNDNPLYVVMPMRL